MVLKWAFPLLPQEVNAKLRSWAATPLFKVFDVLLDGQITTTNYPWKSTLLGFLVCWFLLDTYLSWRQYRLESSKLAPNPEFEKIRDFCVPPVRPQFYASFYEFLLRLGVIWFDILPKIWKATHGVHFHLVPSWLYSIFTQETEHCFLFFNTVILIWTLATIPVFSAIGSSYDILFFCDFVKTNWKKVEGRYGKLIACGLCTVASLMLPYIFSLCFVYYIAPPLEHMRGGYSLFGPEFLVASYLVFGYPLQIFIHTLVEVVSYSLPASEGHTSSLMERSQTKSAIEDLAKQTKFPLGNIYLQNVNNQVELQARHVKVAGPPWRRSIFVTNTAIEKCSTQELTAIVAHHMVDWRHGLIYKITMSTLRYLSYALVMSFAFNWIDICRSFGFTKPGEIPGELIRRRIFFDAPQEDPEWERAFLIKHPASHSEEHPFIIFILMLGGILNPWFSLVDSLINIINRKLETHADASVAKLGLGEQLLQTFLKLHPLMLFDIYMDWLYSIPRRGGNRLLQERAAVLGIQSSGV